MWILHSKCYIIFIWKVVVVWGLLQEKERKQKEKEEKEAAKRIPPWEMFKRGDDATKYSKYDEKGIPTHGADGEEISKKQRKKLEKQYETQQKNYEQVGISASFLQLLRLLLPVCGMKFLVIRSIWCRRTKDVKQLEGCEFYEGIRQLVFEISMLLLSFLIGTADIAYNICPLKAVKFFIFFFQFHDDVSHIFLLENWQIEKFDRFF